LRSQADDHQLLERHIARPHVRASYDSLAELIVEAVDKLVSNVCRWQREDVTVRPSPSPHGGQPGRHPGAGRG